MRYAVRSLAKRPLMSAAVVVTLALGIGANAAVFGVIDALILRPYTMRDVDRHRHAGWRPRRRRSAAAKR